jgi:superfamily II DNA or RNA helicase
MIVLFESSALLLSADSTGVRFQIRLSNVDVSDPQSWPTASVLDGQSALILSDLQLLLEQDLAQVSDAEAIVSPRDWALAVELGAPCLTQFSKPSHLLLEVQRISELGRSDFRYIQRWKEGAREIPVRRYGAYVVHEATARVMHLDARTLALVEAMDSYNALPEAERTKGATWAAFSQIRSDAGATGAQLDDYLNSNTVVIPTNIGLTIRDHGDGSISFEPRIPELASSSALSATFFERLGTDEVETLTDSDGRRIRVLFTDAQREVLRRMRGVRKIRGPEAERMRQDPAAAFDGVADAIDLSSVQMEYGPRVIGVGALRMPSDSHNEAGVRITDLLGLGAKAEPDAAAGATETAPTPQPSAAPPKRSTVAIDVIDAEGGAPVSIRLESEAEIVALRDSAAAAVAAGRPDIEVNGKRVVVEPALLKVLNDHITPPATSQRMADVGAVGKTGHLYLLIDEHEYTLTEALLVDSVEDEQVVPAEEFLPNALLPSVTLESYQRDGVQWLASTRGAQGRRGGVLADDMGLGKTLQLLTHVAHLIESRALDETPGQGPNGPWRPVLIVAPLLLVESGTWTDEMQRRFADDGRVFLPWVVLRDEGLQKVRRASSEKDLLGKSLLDPARLMNHKVVITTYETLVAYQHSLAQRIDGKPIWSLVIFDEAQQVKFPATKKSYAAKALDARFKIAATGTPVETRLRDLWNLLDTVEPTRLGTQRDFVASYERPAQNATDPVVRKDALDRLRGALQYQKPGAFLLRRDKSILSSLPPKIEHRPLCEMTDAERSAHDQLTTAMRGKDARKKALAALHGLHMASQHPGFVAPSAPLGGPDALIESSSRLQLTIEVLRQIEAAGEKALIFARSVEAQRMLAHVIGHVFGRRIDIINGETGIDAGRSGGGTGQVRRRILQQFQSSPGFGAIVLSPFVAGVGLTLIEANHVIHYGRWWNPAVEGQATDRAYRIGQKRPVHVYYPILTDPRGVIGQTFDEALDVLITSRRGLATDFLTPQSEDDDAAALFAALNGRVVNALPQDLVASSVVLNDRVVAMLLLKIADASDSPACWLGEDGKFGAHVLRRTPTAVEVIRIERIATAESFTTATTAVESWVTALGGVRAIPVVVSQSGKEGPSGLSRSWDWVLREAEALGIVPVEGLLAVEPVREMAAVRARLGG